MNGEYKPVFAKYGLALYQCPGRLLEVGGKLAVGIVNVLAHGPSGQSFAVETQLPLGDKATAQTVVAATTYGRRTAGAGIAGLAQVDDDGNEASGRGESRGKAAKYSGPSDTDLLAAINVFTGTAEEMDETLGQQVQDLNDSNVAKVYRAKKRELRGKK